MNPGTGTVDVRALVITAVVTGLISVACSLLLARLTFRFVRRAEMTQQLQDGIAAKTAELEQTLRNELAVDRERRVRDREERIVLLTHEAAGPLSVVVEELLARLRNILDDTGYVQLAQDWDRRRPASWSSTHDYFMSSSIYVFGAYFARVELMRERLGADEHAARRRPVMEAVTAVNGALARWPAAYNEAGCPGGDTQVFAWQQRALGQVLVTRDDTPRVASYADFLAKRQSFEEHVRPLQQLLVDLAPTPEGNCRWQRLQSVRIALVDLQDQSRVLLRER